jgi:hypothetical protein
MPKPKFRKRNWYGWRFCYKQLNKIAADALDVAEFYSQGNSAVVKRLHERFEWITDIVTEPEEKKDEA